jgi:hypothetical protein
MDNSSLKAGLAWMLAGAALALLAVALLRPVSAVQAQAPTTPAPMNGAYQISTWSAIDKNDNVFCGFFIMDTRSGMIINCDYNTVSNMTAKYGK